MEKWETALGKAAGYFCVISGDTTPVVPFTGNCFAFEEGLSAGTGDVDPKVQTPGLRTVE